jgi:hypothetical protein
MLAGNGRHGPGRLGQHHHARAAASHDGRTWQSSTAAGKHPMIPAARRSGSSLPGQARHAVTGQMPEAGRLAGAADGALSARQRHCMP